MSDSEMGATVPYDSPYITCIITTLSLVVAGVVSEEELRDRASQAERRPRRDTQFQRAAVGIAVVHC